MIKSAQDEPASTATGRPDKAAAALRDETDGSDINAEKARVVAPRKRLGNFLRDEGGRHVYSQIERDDIDVATSMTDETGANPSLIGVAGSLLAPSSETWTDTRSDDNCNVRKECFEIDSSPITETCHDVTEHLATRTNFPAVRRLLFLSHLFACSAEVTYQFVLIIFLSRLATDSLFLVSSFGLTTGLLVFLCGGRAGRYLDETGRLGAIWVVLICQNVCILLSTFACYAILGIHNDVGGDRVGVNDADHGSGATPSLDPNVGHASQPTLSWMPAPVQNFLRGVPLDLPTVIALVFVHLLGASAEVFSQASTVAIEKDWVVVIADGGDADSLRRINVAMRQIDLTCKMIGPAAAGFFLVCVGERLRPAVLLAGGINATAVVVEYACLSRICRLVPDLSRERIREAHNNQEIGTFETGGHGSERDVPTGMQVYFSQISAPGGLALALLYLNVLSVGELMTSYLLWRGMRMDVLGIWRGVASVIGLFGTVTYKCSSSNCSLKSTSMWSIAFFFSCLTLCYISLFLRDDGAALVMLVLGVCTSRVGLWTFDMSITQLMQETVPEASRGVVGGTQHSLQAFFFGMHFVLGLFLPDPEQFHILVGFGYAAVGVATLLVLFGVFLNRRLDV